MAVCMLSVRSNLNSPLFTSSEPLTMTLVKVSANAALTVIPPAIIIIGSIIL